MSIQSLILAATAIVLAGAGHSAWAGDAGAALAGSTTAAATPDRVIRITDRTRYVNVSRYETVRFVIAGPPGKESSFDRRFDQNDQRVFPLSDIAPSNFLGGRSIQVYVQRDPPSD